MPYLIDLWLTICGIIGVLVAVREMQKDHPRLVLLATAAWVVVLIGVLLLGLAVRNNSILIRRNEQLIRNNGMSIEAMDRDNVRGQGQDRGEKAP